MIVDFRASATIDGHVIPFDLDGRKPAKSALSSCAVGGESVSPHETMTSEGAELLLVKEIN